MDNKINQVPYERHLVELVDIIIKEAKPCGLMVKTEKGWKVVEHIIQMWQVFYPSESSLFYKSMKKWWEYTKRSGISEEKGGARVQHKLEIPQKLYQLIEAVFPRQKWDKKFVNKFARRFKLFAGNKI